MYAGCMPKFWMAFLGGLPFEKCLKSAKNCMERKGETVSGGNVSGHFGGDKKGPLG
jgi:hypothetical protein